jgi:hypothetical protein
MHHSMHLVRSSFHENGVTGNNRVSAQFAELRVHEISKSDRSIDAVCKVIDEKRGVISRLFPSQPDYRLL